MKDDLVYLLKNWIEWDRKSLFFFAVRIPALVFLPIVTAYISKAQKLALARALYKDSPVVVLDEPTAALDPVAENEIYTRFHSFVKSKTAVYISHRLSGCVFCDRIAVFNHAELAEIGTHEELLALHDKYSALWTAQAQYYV